LHSKKKLKYTSLTTTAQAVTLATRANGARSLSTCAKVPNPARTGPPALPKSTATSASVRQATRTTTAPSRSSSSASGTSVRMARSAYPIGCSSRAQRAVATRASVAMSTRASIARNRRICAGMCSVTMGTFVFKVFY